MVVWGVAAWDMHRTAAEFKTKIRGALSALKQRSPHARLLVNGLHQVWTERCKDGKSSPCVVCNAPLKAAAMRRAILEAAAHFVDLVALLGLELAR